MTLRPRQIAVSALAAVSLLFVAAAAPSPAAAVSPCEAWGKKAASELSNGQAREAVRCLINRQRDQAGLPALDRNKKLQKAAQRHNERMHGTGCFSHQCPGEPALETRLDDYLSGSFSAWGIAENVAWGTGDTASPDAIVKAWMNSSGHRANILSRDWREVGVGFSIGSPSSRNANAGIYTTDFGLRVG